MTTWRRDERALEIARRIQREFGRKLQETRERKGVLQKDLAGHLNLSRTSISNIERGTNRVFLDQVYMAANALGVSAIELLPAVDEMFLQDRVHTAADNPLPEHVALQADAVAKSVQRDLANPPVINERKRARKK